MPALIFAALCVLLALAQDAAPGRPWFHHGSYAALLGACVALMWWSVRTDRRTVLSAFGATVVAAAALASALLALDRQVIARGPGETFALSEPPGRLEFPLTVGAGLQPAAPGAPEFVDSANRRTLIGARATFRGAYAFWSEPHRAAFIEASDPAGKHVTMTQPENTSFLSPVLLFAQTAPIAGRALPVDTFSIPPLQRTVKAVLFSAGDVAAMATLAGDTRPGILFAVENAGGAMLPNAIRFARDGASVSVGGVVLRPHIGTFPQVVIAPVPDLPVLAAGLVLFLAGLLLLLRNRFRSRSGSSAS